ncbi:MAG: C10 family peptidase [Paraprevotella sp.]|nr:C10 family peptidase [Paraprevotella sp.]
MGRDSVSFDEVRGKLCQRVDDYGRGTVPARFEAYDYPAISFEGIIPPVTKTTWSQKEPYSNYLPVSYNLATGMLAHYPAGCVIVAGVQTLAAVAPNITVCDVDIDWNYLTTQPKINYNSYAGGDSKGMNMVATVVKDMYEKTGTTPNTDHEYQYDPDDDPSIPCVLNSSTDVSRLIEYLNQYVSCGKYYNEYVPDPLFLTMKANQKLPCVAIMGARNENGGSHAWILDGYAICEKMTKGILRNRDLYFHANMGWGGTDDGFYKVNGDTSIDFKTAQGTYNIDFWEITEIHSK